jgi:lysophospholipase L1-like esterase
MNSKIFLAACLLFCIALGGTGYAQTRVACVGDSITAGWKLKEADKYVTKLGGLLGAGYDVRNFGHSAYSMLTIADKSYWYSPMFQAAQDFQPDIVTIMLGTNDAHPDYWPQYQSDYVSDYGDMITFFENLPSKPRVIVLGLPYLKPGGRYDGVVALDALLPGVAGAAEVDYVEIWDVQLDSGLSERQLMKDPIHPSAASHTIIAETVYPVVADVGNADCGDGMCNAGEDACNCADDCGPAPASESRCSDLLDNDCDGPAVRRTAKTRIVPWNSIARAPATATASASRVKTAAAVRVTVTVTPGAGLPGAIAAATASGRGLKGMAVATGSSSMAGDAHPLQWAGQASTRPGATT